MIDSGKVHVLSLHPGDLFRYDLDGPVFRIVEEKGRYKARHVDPSQCQLLAVLDIGGCYVYPVNAARDEQEPDDQ